MKSALDAQATAEQRRRIPECFAEARALALPHGRAGRFDWLLRSRPDLYFYAPPPELSSLDPSGVHVRMRCYAPLELTVGVAQSLDFDLRSYIEV